MCITNRLEILQTFPLEPVDSAGKPSSPGSYETVNAARQRRMDSAGRDGQRCTAEPTPAMRCKLTIADRACPLLPAGDAALVGVFDSGVGGLSVVRELRALGVTG